MTNILIYDDNRDLANGLSLLLNAVDDFRVCGTFDNCDNIRNDLQAQHIDLILMDIEMPGIGGLSGLKIAKSLPGNIKVLMLTVFEDNDKIFESLRHGADGYILKKTSPVKIIEYIRDAMEGGAPMTPIVARKVLTSFAEARLREEDTQTLNVLSDREKEVLRLMVDGHTYKMVAEHLSLSIDTIRSHVKRIYDKLRVNSKAQAVAKSLRKKDDH